MNAAATRMDVGSTPQIVILVVVGSSPISHPKISPLCYCAIALKRTATPGFPGVVISGRRIFFCLRAALLSLFSRLARI